MDVQALVEGVPRSDIFEFGGILVNIVVSLSLIERIKAQRYFGCHLFASRHGIMK